MHTTLSLTTPSRTVNPAGAPFCCCFYARCARVRWESEHQSNVSRVVLLAFQIIVRSHSLCCGWYCHWGVATTWGSCNQQRPGIVGVRCVVGSCRVGWIGSWFWIDVVQRWCRVVFGGRWRPRDFSRRTPSGCCCCCRSAVVVVMIAIANGDADGCYCCCCWLSEPWSGVITTGVVLVVCGVGNKDRWRLLVLLLALLLPSLFFYPVLTLVQVIVVVLPTIGSVSSGLDYHQRIPNTPPHIPKQSPPTRTTATSSYFSWSDANNWKGLQHNLDPPSVSPCNRLERRESTFRKKCFEGTVGVWWVFGDGRCVVST